MLRSCKYSIIGLHLLLLVHITNTFVLLTANVEDVKKLARKFVSDSVAEKIADFITKATEQMANKGIGEKPQEESHQVSEENNMYNIGRQGDSGAQDALKSREDTLPEKQDDLAELNSNSFEATTKSEFDNLDTEKEKGNFPRLEGPSRYANIDPNNAKQYGFEPQDGKAISKISEEDERYEKEYKQNKFFDDNFVTSTEPTEIYIPDKPRKTKRKGHPYKLLANVNSGEVNEVAEYRRKNDTIDDIFDSDLFQNRAVDLTTRKAVFEFDQYENQKSPKSKFVATSGPVALPEIPLDKTDHWWEKELPDVRKRRSYFE